MEGIRQAKTTDIGRMYEIYLFYVNNTAVTFDLQPPAYQAFEKNIETHMEQFPVLVAEEDGTVAGYAYAGPFLPKGAYARCCELTIYLDVSRRRKGIGRRLYEALEKELQKRGYLNLYACIGIPRGKDPYLTLDSQRFHEKMGFRTVGTFHECGYKFERWYDMIWMEKMIGDHPDGFPNADEFRQNVEF